MARFMMREGRGLSGGITLSQAEARREGAREDVESDGSRVRKALAVLLVGAAASLLFLPELGSRIVPSGIGAEEPRRIGSWAAVNDLSHVVDVILSYPRHESAILIGRSGAFASTSSQQLAHYTAAYPVFDVWQDPTLPRGYRFGPNAASSGSATLALPEEVRFLLIPDAGVAALLDPTLFHTEQRAAGSSYVTVAHVPEGSVLELRTHGSHVHIGHRPAGAPATAPPDVSRIRVVAARETGQITGPESPNDTGARWDVYGTDLGSVFWHRDRLYMLFGDTFGEGSRWEGTNWRSNAMARLATPGAAPDVLQIDTMVTGAYAFAREILPSRKRDGVEMTVLPTSGISMGDRMFLHYMSVQRWIESGYWVVGHSGMAYSDDEGLTWHRPPGAVWPGDLGFGQAALVRHEGRIYSFGLSGGRYGDVRLRRVDEARILEADAYEYWDGAAWVADPERAATLIPGPAGQLSVAWNPYYRVWMMMYLMPSVDAIVLRLAPEIVGPWSDWQFVVPGSEHPGLYAPYVVPLPETGEDVWFTMSKWWPYNVYLMRMTLGDPETLPLTPQPAPEPPPLPTEPEAPTQAPAPTPDLNDTPPPGS